MLNSDLKIRLLTSWTILLALALCLVTLFKPQAAPVEMTTLDVPVQAPQNAMDLSTHADPSESSAPKEAIQP